MNAVPATLADLPSQKDPRADKTPTAAQRAKARTGDSLTVRILFDGFDRKTECTVRKAVTGVTSNTYSLFREVLAGEPPPGMPKAVTTREWFCDLPDVGRWSIGQTNVILRGQARHTEARLEDTIVAVGDLRLPAALFEAIVHDPNGATQALVRTWVALDSKVPLDGKLRVENAYNIRAPGQVFTIRTVEELVRFQRGDQP